MTIPGRIQNGVVILEGGPALPEGTLVSVTYPALSSSKMIHEKRRIQVPLVRSDRPGSVELTGERIAEILDKDGVAARR